MGDSFVGLQARLMSQALRKLAGSLNRSGTVCVFTNQLREKIGVMFGSPETTPGGRALKFYASVRLDIRRIETLKDGAEAYGNRVRVKVVKNKVAPPFRQAEFDVIYGHGISWEGTVLDVGLEKAVVQKSGSFLSFEEERIGQGREKAKAFLREHPGRAPAHAQPHPGGLGGLDHPGRHGAAAGPRAGRGRRRGAAGGGAASPRRRPTAFPSRPASATPDSRPGARRAMDDVRERALDAAGKALARRALSRAALEARLAGVASARGLRRPCVDDLERLGYVDDEALALALAEQRLASGWGPGRVEADLERLAVARPRRAPGCAPPRRARRQRRARCSPRAPRPGARRPAARAAGAARLQRRGRRERARRARRACRLRGWTLARHVRTRRAWRGPQAVAGIVASRSRRALLRRAAVGRRFASATHRCVLGESWHLGLGEHAWLALLGVGVQACGWLLIARSLSSFSAVAVSVLLLLQPALAAVWGVAFLDETLIAIQVAGIAIVLLGVAFARPRADRAPARVRSPERRAASRGDDRERREQRGRDRHDRVGRRVAVTVGEHARGQRADREGGRPGDREDAVDDAVRDAALVRAARRERVHRGRHDREGRGDRDEQQQLRGVGEAGDQDAGMMAERDGGASADAQRADALGSAARERARRSRRTPRRS